MAEGKKVFLKIIFVLTAGILYYTVVNSREISTEGKGSDLEEENLVEKARSIAKTLTWVRTTRKTNNLINDKRSHMEENSYGPQREERSTNEENLEVRDIKMKAKIRKPRAEPETSQPTSEPEVKPENKAEPETNPNSTSEPEPFLWAEPEPEWDTAVEVWKTAWPLHVYGLGSIFVLLGIISLTELIRIHARSRRKTALKVSLLIMMSLFCMTRSATLFSDPYGSKGIMNPILSRLLFTIGHPCIISAMSLLLLVLIDTTKMDIAPPTFQRVQFIIAVVFFHIVLVLITDIVVAFYVQTKVLILICQIYYLLLGLILTIGYARVGIKIATNSSASVTRDAKMEKLKILIGLASATGFAIVSVTIYGAVGVFGIYSNVKVVDPWPWWAFQTVFRVLEVIMVVVLLVMNVNVTGSGIGIRELLGKCRRKIFQNKVDTTKSVLPISHTNSWMTNSVHIHS